MKVKITHTSDWSGLKDSEIEINTLEELITQFEHLIELSSLGDDDLKADSFVISKITKESFEIEVYDTWRE